MKVSAEEYRKMFARSSAEGVSMGQLLKEKAAEVQRNKVVSNLEKSYVTKKHGHPESDLQRQCVEWFRAAFPSYSLLLFHPNNEPYFGGAGKSIEKKAFDGHMANLMGVVKGVADLILLVPSYDGKYHGLCIEMKSAKGVQRDSQKDWQCAVESQGYRYEVVRDFLSFRRIIIEHIHHTKM
jgi:hypothetical protein